MKKLYFCLTSLSLLIFSGCMNNSQTSGAKVDMTTCPDKPKEFLDGQDVELITLTNQMLTKQIIARQDRSIGLTFEGKAGQKLSYTKDNKNICSWIFTPDNKVLTGETLPTEGKYTMQILALQGFPKIDIKIGLDVIISSPNTSTSPTATNQNEVVISSVNETLLVISPRFDAAGRFAGSVPIAPVRIGDKWGYIDKTGNLIIQPQFDNTRRLSENLAPVKINGKWGYIDEKGVFIIQPQFDDAIPFSEGLAAVKINNRWGYIDKVGNFQINLQFDDAERFSDGLAPVKKDNKWGFIDKKQSFVIQPQFDDAGYFSEGLSPVKSNSKWGYIDKTGSLKIATEFDDVWFFEEGLAAVQIGSKWGYIDKSGNLVIKSQFNNGDSFYEGLAAVQINDKWGCIDQTGNFIINPQFEGGGYFYAGLAPVKINDKWGYIRNPLTKSTQPKE